MSKPRIESRWIGGLAVAVSCLALNGPVRCIAERLVYPAIDVNASSTRHEELLFDGRKQLELVWRLRRVLNGLAEDGSSARSLELLIEKLRTTKTNEEFLADVAKAQNQTI